MNLQSLQRAITCIERINKYNDTEIADAAGELLKELAAEEGDRGDAALIALEHLYRYTSHRRRSFQDWLTYHEQAAPELAA
jgi:hypothetical protein